MNNPSNKTIIEKYLQHYNTSKQSQKMRKSSLNYFFNNFNFEDHVFDITTETLIDYFDWLKSKKDISLTTKKNKWTILVSFLKSTMEYYRKYNFIVIIPKHSINWGNGHKEAKSNKTVIATIEEIQNILKHIKTRNYVYYLIFRLFVETGCRKGLLVNATIENLDTKKRIIKGYEKSGFKAYYFSKKLSEHLEMYLNDIRSPIKTTSKNVFLNNRNEPYSLRTFNLILKRTCKELGITKNITCHTFRRTLNTLRKKMDCSNEDRKILLNHSVNDVNLQSYTILEYENFIQLYDKWNPYIQMIEKHEI